VSEKKGKKKMKNSLLILSIAIATVGGSAVSAPKPNALQAGAPVSSQPAQAAAADVKIDNFSFGPATLTVAVGTTVTWINNDDIPHTVVSTDKAFRSKVLDTGEKFSFTFTKAGEYPYFCSIHPKMTGKVVVH
jgi:plastocyanin